MHLGLTVSKKQGRFLSQSPTFLNELQHTMANCTIVCRANNAQHHQDVVLTLQRMPVAGENGTAQVAETSKHLLRI
jgi:hypothetical protein